MSGWLPLKPIQKKEKIKKGSCWINPFLLRIRCNCCEKPWERHFNMVNVHLLCKLRCYKTKENRLKVACISSRLCLLKKKREIKHMKIIFVFVLFWSTQTNAGCTKKIIYFRIRRIMNVTISNNVRIAC